MIKNIELKERFGVSNNSATAEIINQQKEELQYLERMEEERKKDEQKRLKKEREDKLRAEKEVLFIIEGVRKKKTWRRKIKTEKRKRKNCC